MAGTAHDADRYSASAAALGVINDAGVINDKRHVIDVK
jgi:hypothetical protein